MGWKFYFITDRKSLLFEEAYSSLSEFENIELEKVAESIILSNVNKLERNCYIVFSQFTGKAFDIFNSLEVTIFSPHTLLHCIKQSCPLPKNKFPLFNRKLKDITVCISHVDKDEKEKLSSLINMMEGVVLKHFTKTVKVLLTNKVGSRVYMAACDRNVIVLRPSWIYDIWELSSGKLEFDPFEENCVKLHQVSVFFGLQLCFSGFSVSEKDRYRHLVESNGGVYHSELKQNEVTHLIAKSPNGEKYKFACKWNVRVVLVEWLIDSINNGFCLDVTNYECSDEGGQIRKKLSERSFKNYSVPLGQNNDFSDESFEFENFDMNLSEAAVSTGTTVCVSDATRIIIIDTNAENDALFSGLRFFVDEMLSEFSSEKLVKAITENGGQIVGQLSGNCYVVSVAFLHHPYKCEKRVKLVTEFYVMKCVDENRVLNIADDFLFSPVVIDASINDILADCVVSFVGFSGRELDELHSFALKMGTNIQEIVMEKSCPNKHLKATTHVIAKDNTHVDCKSARMLRVPVVRKQWLLASVQQKCRANILEFLIDPKQSLRKKSKFVDVDVITSNDSSKKVLDQDTKMTDNKDSRCEMDEKEPLPLVINLAVTCESLASSVTDVHRPLKRKHKEFGKVTAAVDLGSPLKIRDNDSLQEAVISQKVSQNYKTFPGRGQMLTRENSDSLVDIGWEYTSNNVHLNNKTTTDINEEPQENLNKSSHTSVVSSPIVAHQLHCKTKKIFAFSGVVETEKSRLISQILNLGGQYNDQALLTDGITHLICASPNRSEKFLAAMASGKWILHASFVDESTKNGEWLDEASYEWGNANEVLSKSTPLLLAVKKWRERRGNAFIGWNVVLVENEDKIFQIANILTMGGAKVLPIDKGFPSIETVSHAFLRSNYSGVSIFPLPLEYEWLKLEYIVSHLLAKNDNDEIDKRKMFLYSKKDIKIINAKK